MKPAVEKLLLKIRDHCPEPDAERLSIALSGSGEPDRVPFMELFADGEVMAAILGKPLDYFSKELGSRREWKERMLSLIEFHALLDYDYVRADTRGYEAIVKKYEIDRGTLAAGEVGSRAYRHRLSDASPELNRGDRLWANEAKGVIADWDDFEAYDWEDPEEVADEGVEGLEFVCENVPKGMGVVAGSGAILEPVMWLMGFQSFFVSTYSQPDLIEAMFRRVGELSLARFNLAAKASREIVAFWGSDDWGYRKGLMISPEMMRRWVFPVHSEMADAAHSRGSLYVLHSCGNLEAIMDDIIDDVKVDAKHSFEDTYLSVTKAKEAYGNRISLVGGIDMDVLARGSPTDVREYTRRVLEACKPGGGYCLGSGNTVANYVPLENYLTMIDAGLEHGWYS